MVCTYTYVQKGIDSRRGRKVMKKNIVFTVCIVLFLSLLLASGCSRNSSITFEKEAELSTLMITGVIMERTYNNELLVVVDNGEHPDAMRVSFKTDVEVVNQLGEEIAYLDLKVGMKVSCFGRGMINDSYPQQASCEKIVVDESYKMPRIYEEMDLVEAVGLYGSSNLSKSYPLIGMSINDEFSVPFKNESQYKMSFEMMMDEAFVFFDLSGDEPKVRCYEGSLNIYTIKDGEYKENPYNLNHIIIQKDYEPKFIETEEGMAFILPTVVDKELVQTILLLNEDGKLSTRGIYEKETYKNERYNYSVVGETMTNKYYIVNDGGRELALLPNEYIELLQEDKNKIDAIQIEHYTNNLTLVYEGELSVYNSREKLWRKVPVEGDVQFANYYADSGVYDIFVENASGMEYSYDWNEGKVKTRIRIGSSYMNQGITWDGKLYINYVYQVGEDVGPIVFIDQESNVPSLDITIGANGYQVVDSFLYNGKTYIIDAKDDKVIDIYTGASVLEASVGLYCYSDGILAYEDKESGYWYSFNFLTMENKLFSEVEIPIVKVHHGEIGMVDTEGNISIISAERGEKIQAFHITDMLTGLIGSDVLFDFDKERIYINVGTTYVVDRKELNIVDQFITRDIHVSEEGRFFYTALGGLFEYNADKKTHRAIVINEHCIYVNSFKDKVIVYHGMDGPGSYGIFDMDESWYETSAGEGIENYDYVLFYEVNEYGSSLYVLDNVQERIYLLTSSEGMINYYVEEDQILYQPLIRGLYGEPQQPKGELMAFRLSEGASIFIYDFNVMSYYQRFTHNVEEGYVYENEFYKFDDGKILVMTDPIYKGGLFNEKTLGVYIHGAHQKGYTLIIQGFKMPSRANVYVAELNEARDMLLIAYELEGQKYGAYFEIDVIGFRLRHKETIQFMNFETEDGAMDYLRGQINQ